MSGFKKINWADHEDSDEEDDDDDMIDVEEDNDKDESVAEDDDDKFGILNYFSSSISNQKQINNFQK